MGLLKSIKKINIILSKHQQIRVAQLIIIMILGGFMEMMSVSLIIPFMDAIVNPSKVMDNKYIKPICRLLSIEDSKFLLIYLALLLAFVYIIKNVYLMFQMTIQNRFTLRNMLAMQQKILHGILLRPYEYFLEAQSGEIMRVLNDDVVGAFNMLSSVLSLFSELIVSGLLIITIFVISPIVTISIAVLFAIMLAIIMFFIRPILIKASIAQQQARAKTNLWILQAIQGIKELKITNTNRFFEENYKKNGDIYVKCMFTYQILSVMPRFLIEAVAMASFFIVIAILIASGVEFSKIIPVVSGVAMAAMRILPSINRISSNYSGISYSEPMLDKLINHLEESCNYENEIEKEKYSTNKIEYKERLTFSNITYRYPTGNKDVLSGASFTVKKNQSIGIIGASGSGKSTAVDIILGLLQPSKGNVFIDDVSIYDNMNSWLTQVGYIPQSIFLLDGTIRDNVAFGVEPNNVDDSRVWQSLKEAALFEFVDNLPDGLNTELGERGVRLSGGQRQRIGIARALYNNPDMLVFDEATSALDNDTEQAIMDSIDTLQGNKTLIIIAHRLSTIMNCDVIFKVEGGKISEIDKSHIR